jgi:hypothetical protein
MPSNWKTLGLDAQCSVLLSFLRPSASIDQRFPNKVAGQRLCDLIAVHMGEVTRNGNKFFACFFKSKSFPDVELYTAKQYVKVVEEGPSDLFFDVAPPSPATPQEEVATEENAGTEFDFQRTGDVGEDIRTVLAQGLAVDDDNAPAPENVPEITQTPRDESSGLFEGQRFSWNGVCQCKLMTNQKLLPGFNNWRPGSKTSFDFFLQLVPIEWFKTSVVENTSDSLRAAGLQPTSFGKMCRFLGLWLLIATVVGFPRRDFFTNRDYDEKNAPCPYRLAKYMSPRQFEDLLSHLRPCKPNPPALPGRFWEVREMMKAWKDNMAAVFIPSWIVCLDESMSIWLSRWTCPGCFFCPRKPHPFGNEYHTICCGDSGILFDLEIVEGRTDRVRSENQSFMNTETLVACSSA